MTTYIHLPRKQGAQMTARQHKLHTILAAGGLALLAGCATNQPFDAAQRAIIKQHTIVTEKLPADYAEPLPVYTRAC